jgi:hypothetical protein
MLRIKEAMCNKHGLKALTVITDCLLYYNKTVFLLQRLDVIIKEYKYKNKNKYIINRVISFIIKL